MATTKRSTTKAAKQPNPTPESPADRARLQVLCTREQEMILTEAATKAGFAKDRSAWILAQALKAARSAVGGQAHAPVILTGELAEKLRAAAEQQGISPEQFVRLQMA